MDVFVARQPIFDRKGEVAGFELLYRENAQSLHADGQDSARMSIEVVIQSFLEVGLEKITRGRTGFINFGEEMLLSGCYELLNPRTVVVELLEDVPVTPEIMATCQSMAAAGYRLALDDFVPGGVHEVLVPFADILKLDVLNRSPEEITRLAEGLRGRGAALLAERVETPEVHRHCLALGFELFQGYFYSRPEVLSNRGTSVEQETIIRLLNLVSSEAASESEIEEAFRRSPSLSYKLLRMINTAAHGGRGVESIAFAMRLLGRATLHRWLSLLLASSLAGGGGTDLELVHLAVVRARFCELLGNGAERPWNGDTLFLLGIFSLMDSLLRTPMEEVLQRVDLAGPVRDALLRREGDFAVFLSLVEAYESADWEEVTRLAPDLGVSGLAVPGIYLEALHWARHQVQPESAAA